MKGIKYYPKSATTNSTFGISKLREVNHLIKIKSSIYLTMYILTL